MTTNLEVIDAGITRGALLAGGGALTVGALLPDGALAATPSKRNDIAILKYALTLEYLEAAFYAEAVTRGALTGEVAEVARQIAAHEASHVTALKKAIKGLGAKVPKSPSFDFKDTTGDQATFLQNAFVLEDTGVHAYLGQVANIRSRALLKAAAAILTTEARHAAAIAGYIDDKPYDLSGAGHNFTPQGAFDTGWSKAHVLKNVTATGFITS
jgi:hypothetical protein